MPEFYMILARKIIKIPDFLMIFARKINKIPEFYMIFARKMPEFYIIIARKIFSPDFFFGGGEGARASPAPIFYAYELVTHLWLLHGLRWWGRTRFGGKHVRSERRLLGI